nr:hypothetical protein [uncultured archaeon]
MKTKKIIVSGLIAGIVAFIVGSLLYMNPLVSGVYAQYSNYPCSKPMDVFGGLINWLFLMLIGGVVSAVFMAFLYAFTEKGIDIKPAWKKGLLFGFLLFLVNKLPTSYYSWLMYTYPNVLNVIETFNGLIGGLVGGVTLAVVYAKLK